MAALLQALPPCQPAATGIPVLRGARQRDQEQSPAEGVWGVALGRWSWGCRATQWPWGLNPDLARGLGRTSESSISASSLSSKGTPNARFFQQPKLPIQKLVISKEVKPPAAREDVNGGLDGSWFLPSLGLGFRNTKHQSCTPTTSTLPIRSKRGSKTFQPDQLFRWGARGPHGGTVTARSCGEAVPLSPELGPQGGAGLSIWPWLYLPHMWIPLPVPHGRLTTLVLESSL